MEPRPHLSRRGALAGVTVLGALAVGAGGCATSDARAVRVVTDHFRAHPLVVSVTAKASPYGDMVPHDPRVTADIVVRPGVGRPQLPEFRAAVERFKTDKPGVVSDLLARVAFGLDLVELTVRPDTNDNRLATYDRARAEPGIDGVEVGSTVSVVYQVPEAQIVDRVVSLAAVDRPKGTGARYRRGFVVRGGPSRFSALVADTVDEAVPALRAALGAAPVPRYDVEAVSGLARFDLDARGQADADRIAAAVRDSVPEHQRPELYITAQGQRRRYR